MPPRLKFPNINAAERSRNAYGPATSCMVCFPPFLALGRVQTARPSPGPVVSIPLPIVSTPQKCTFIPTAAQPLCVLLAYESNPCLPPVGGSGRAVSSRLQSRPALRDRGSASAALPPTQANSPEQRSRPQTRS
ncbi:hypothetical protein L226DRAFT_298040 [Lentinus tigrinus ALCF2SS1-7]|uniref:uncharacterized protein n=1 Tax=Lentinus tigrinus ALCF2SS1-7 TaxID=1328758 RepID=UPI0011661298|nr:hypothetical protein L226DRAFT_298040 [Lentinus tigrinus ALCF2SS1-7]